MLKRAIQAQFVAPDTQQAEIPSSRPGPHAHAIEPLGNRTVNVHKTSQPSTFKRKQDGHVGNTKGNNNLAQLHTQLLFSENDFDDDKSIDLEYSVQPIKLPPTSTSSSIQYPSIDSVSYPNLPPIQSSSPQPPQPPQSSLVVPWSSSPALHWEIPQRQQVAPPSPEQQRPSKRRKLPWKVETDTVNATQATEQPPTIANTSKFLWDVSTSVVKSEQKELRKRHAAKAPLAKPTLEKPTKVPATHLSEEQRAVAKAVVDDGNSVFFTGSAGTGKSVLMRDIIGRLRKKYVRESDRLAITASTGLAACVIEGTTLHSWAGIGLGKEPVAELVKRIKRNAKSKARWLRTKALIIDEISMVDGELFDKLESIARSIRNNGRPFGGIQLVVTGDFFQLPPVPDNKTVAKFAFDAATWSNCIQHTILLTHVFRQKDPLFANMLNEMRLGNLSPDSVRAFQKLSRPLNFNDDIDATELFPTRAEVDSANVSRLQRLSGQEMKFDAIDSGINDEMARKKILSNYMAPESLTLKKGAQVMLIKNIDSQLVNGSLGRVTAFMDEACYAAYKENEEVYHLAHEPEGGSDEEEKAAARRKFNAARFKNKDGPPSRYWPMVRFPAVDGTFREMLCIPEEWTTENQQGEIVAKRVQIPLILAWALSIHKAQGQTLSRVKVDLGKVFERGQAYVALSRATSQDGLQVLRFDARKVMVHPKVVSFYQKLVNIQSVVAAGGKGGSGRGETVPKRSNSSLTDDDDDDDEFSTYE